MNDRQRVEALLFPQMLLAVLIAGVGHKDDEYEKCKALLLAACEEILHDLDDRRRSSILRRTYRLQLAVTEPYRKEGVPLAKVGLMELYVLQRILDDNYLVLTEGSSMAKALDLIVPALGHALEEPKLNTSAQKQAGKMLSALQAAGYFETIGAQYA
jgi:hypothetical protein